MAGNQKMIDKRRAFLLFGDSFRWGLCTVSFIYYAFLLMFDQIRDDHGNKIICEKTKKGGDKFYLYLKGHQYRRLIAQYVNGILHFVRTQDHIYIKTNSYGFNDSFIRKFAPETVVLVREKGYRMRLQTTVGTILNQGTYLYFLAQGFEKQVFLNRSIFEKVL